MTVSYARILAEVMVQLGLAVRSNIPSTPTQWPVTTGQMPETGDYWLTVYNTGGDTQGTIHPTGRRVFRPTCQVRVRALNDKAGWTKARQLEEAFDQIKPTAPILVTLDGQNVQVLSVFVYSPVMPLGQEENKNRQLFTTNVQLVLREI